MIVPDVFNFVNAFKVTVYFSRLFLINNECRMRTSTGSVEKSDVQLSERIISALNFVSSGFFDVRIDLYNVVLHRVNLYLKV